MNEEILPRRIENTEMAVETRGVTKRFGSARALDGLDLTVPDGAFYLLVGPNGAGKSTSIRILLDTARADSGMAEVFGIDTRRGAEVRASVGWVPEGREAHYGWMRVDRLIRHHAAYYPTWDEGYAAHLGDVLRIKTSRKYGKLSKGEARRVQLLLALAHRPRLLLMDEPTDGLDPAARELVLGLLAEHLAQAPATVLAATHRVYEMDRLADHVGVLRDGSCMVQTTRRDLSERLRHYVVAVPDGRMDGVADGLNVLRTNGSGRDRAWTVWGDEADVVERLTRGGATVRETTPISLEDAAVVLLNAEV